MAGPDSWWREWDGVPPRVDAVIVRRVVVALAVAGMIAAVLLDGTPVVLLLAVVAFNVGGAMTAWRVSRRFDEQADR